MQRPSRETRVQHQQRCSLLLLPLSVPSKIACQGFQSRPLGFSPGAACVPIRASAFHPVGQCVKALTIPCMVRRALALAISRKLHLYGLRHHLHCNVQAAAARQSASTAGMCQDAATPDI